MNCFVWSHKIHKHVFLLHSPYLDLGYIDPIFTLWSFVSKSASYTNVRFLECICGRVPPHLFFIDTSVFPVGKSINLPGETLPWGMKYPSSSGIYKLESLDALFPTCANTKPGTIVDQDKEHKLELELHCSHTAALGRGMSTS